MTDRPVAIKLLSKSALLLRAVAALLSGAITRHLRRMTSYNPRIWHVGFPMHMTKEMVRLERAAGLESYSLVPHCRLNPQYALVSADDFDIVVENLGISPDRVHWETFLHLARKCDILVAYFDFNLASPSHPETTSLALQILKACGVRIVFLPNGLDVVHNNGFKSRYDAIAAVTRDYPNWDLTAETPLIRRRIAVYSNLANFVISGDSFTRRFMTRADLQFKYFPSQKFDFETTASGPVVRILHAPNHRIIKGTSALQAAVDELVSLGFPCELVLIERTPPEVARKLYAEADIVADQFCLGAFGMFALEGLAMGKPVLTYLDEEHLGDPAYNLPIVNATPENLPEVLAVLILVPELRVRLGFAGRRASAEYQSHTSLGEIWNAIYSAVWHNRSVDKQALPYFTHRQPRSFSEDPAETCFWPVDLNGLTSEIEQALNTLSIKREELSR